ncbi:hypothetical protein ABE485_01700 [Achromobacter spanius]|uniref:hypothetical protein n=1 Tax=Achromobacter spanius TaxID=217203 RepID=UPI00320AC86D
MQNAYNNTAKGLGGVLLCGLVLLGMRYLWHESAWPLRGMHDDAIWATGIVLAGLAFAIVSRRHAHALLLTLALGWVGLGVDLRHLAVIPVWLASAWSMGGILLGGIHRDRTYALKFPIEATMVGITAWLAIWGVMLHFEINYRGVYWGLCLLPFVHLTSLPEGALRSTIANRLVAFEEWARSIPLWMWVPGIAIIGWMLRWSSLPSVMFDDHALHLRMWTTFEHLHRAEFNPADQIWSVAPFASDLLHAALSLMVGDDIRGAWNLTLALMTLGLTASILQYTSIRPRWQWLLLILLASTPMFGNLLLSLQTELALAVVALTALLLIIRATRTGPTHIIGVLACAGLCVAIKLPGAVLGAMCMLALAKRIGIRPLIPRHWPNAASWLTLLMVTFVALHAYGVSWHFTRNPVFPLYNSIFRSPFFPPEDFRDTTWSAGFTLRSYIDAFFQTSKYFESGNYAAGWQYLILLPIAVIAALLPGPARQFRIVLFPMLGFGIAMFAAVQYWRYLFPVMPLAIVLMGALFIDERPRLRIFIMLLALLCIGFNLRFYRNISGLMQVPAQSAFTSTGREWMLRSFAPVAALTNTVNNLAPGARVLYPFESPAGATLRGQPIYTPWYAPARSLRFQGIRDAQDAADFIARERPDFVIANQTDTGPTKIPNGLIREYMVSRGRLIDQTGPYMLYQVSGSPTPLAPSN